MSGPRAQARAVLSGRVNSANKPLTFEHTVVESFVVLGKTLELAKHGIYKW